MSRVLVLIMAGGEGSRMDLLTKDRAKPALPYAGVFRLIDFPLTNCVHSRLSDVWILQQYHPHSLNEHISNGRPWDLDRTYGGLRVLHPHTGTRGGGMHHGNADAVFRNRTFIRDFAPDVVVMLSADHVYKLDFRAVIEHHAERSAGVTMVTTKVPLEQSTRFGVVKIGRNGKVSEFHYKPDDPIGEDVTTEVFVYDASLLLDTLEEIAEEKDEDDPDLEDFGDALLPRLVDRGEAYAWELDGYWRDVGTIASYWHSHMELLDPQPPIHLDDPAWPILTLGSQRVPAAVHESARVDNSLLAPGCVIRGAVIRSIVGPGVKIADGARIEDSVIFDEVVIEANAVVSGAIVDSSARIGRDARVGKLPSTQPDDEDITIVGQDARVDDGAELAAGARHEG